MADAQPGRVQQVVEFDDELLIHIVCRVPANVFRKRRVDELRRLVLHQLEHTNSSEPTRPVKTMEAETASRPQLLAIHYCFARGLQEKSVARPGGSVTQGPG